VTVELLFFSNFIHFLIEESTSGKKSKLMYSLL
jgi:hypothetical protein